MSPRTMPPSKTTRPEIQSTSKKHRIPEIDEINPAPNQHAPNVFWLVFSTHLKNISQIGNLPQIEVKIKNISNHHPVLNIYLHEIHEFR